MLDLVTIHLHLDKELREHMKNALSVMNAFGLFERYPQLHEITLNKLKKCGFEKMIHSIHGEHKS